MGFIFVHLIRLKVGHNIVVYKNNEFFKPNPTRMFYPSMRSGHISGSFYNGVFEDYGVWSHQVDEFDCLKQAAIHHQQLNAKLG